MQYILYPFCLTGTETMYAWELLEANPLSSEQAPMLARKGIAKCVPTCLRHEDWCKSNNWHQFAAGTACEYAIHSNAAGRLLTVLWAAHADLAI